MDNSTSRGKRSKSLGKSRLTRMLLRSPNPFTYSYNADFKPTSSRRGGCNRWEIVRISERAWPIRERLSSTFRATPRLSLDSSSEIAEMFMLKAASNCPAPSCNSRAIRLLSSSWSCSKRPESSASCKRRASRLRSVMSRATFEAPMTQPCASLTGEMVTETSNKVPSFRLRTVSK